MDTTCEICGQLHFIPNRFTKCLKCRMKEKKAEDIARIKKEVAENMKKTAAL